MTPYDITFKPSVEKDLHPLPRTIVERILARIESLRSDPFPRQAAKLSGVERLYRIRIGDYRVIYAVDTQAGQITVHYIRHRREAYRQL